MKLSNLCLAIFVFATMPGLSTLTAQITVSPWEIHEGTEGIVKHDNPVNGDPSAYQKMKMPAQTAGGWIPAPKDVNGNVFIDRSSTVQCRKELDFTYFQTVVSIPQNTEIKQFVIAYDKADDGARIYIFNSKYPNGTFDSNADLIISSGRNNTGTVDLKDKIAPGVNRIVIAQFDDCADRNGLRGIHVKVNGSEVPPVVSLPDKFKVLAYSVNQGKTADKDNYWFALNANDSRGRILSEKKLTGGAKWMEIDEISLGNNTYVFKVLNAGSDMYLVARDNKEVHVEKANSGALPEGAKFKLMAPLTAAPGANERHFHSFESVKFPAHYLRHAGFAMFVHTTNNSELFRQDASWLTQKI